MNNSFTAAADSRFYVLRVQNAQDISDEDLHFLDAKRVKAPFRGSAGGELEERRWAVLKACGVQVDLELAFLPGKRQAFSTLSIEAQGIQGKRVRPRLSY